MDATRGLSVMLCSILHWVQHWLDGLQRAASEAMGRTLKVDDEAPCNVEERRFRAQ